LKLFQLKKCYFRISSLRRGIRHLEKGRGGPKCEQKITHFYQDFQVIQN
jgi:hypothetical protein